VIIGNDATGGAVFDARSTLTSVASSVAANASADSGSSSTGVTGINANDITVGRNGGTIYGQATSTLNASASTAGSNTTATSPTAATANAFQTATGVKDTTVTIGGDANLTALANLSGTATASNIGDVASPLDDKAVASLTLNGTGISNTAGDATVIGASGNVIGQALVNGGATAQSVNGDANGTAGINTLGLNLNNAGSDITIGKSGNITGFAVTGALTGTTFTDQVDVVASTTNGVANAGGSFDTTGILGVGPTTVLTAGPNDGSISGSAYGGAKLIASSTAGAATTGIGNDTSFTPVDSTDIVGIKDVNLFGGQVGTNTISGSGFGKFDSTATSIKGAATGISNVNVNGILGTIGGESITTSGNVNAQAILSNTVTASSVSGAATATATSNAVGLSGYNVTIIGSGNLVAGASSTSLSTASSNAGNAGA
jgi:hypothetical protein